MANLTEYIIESDDRIEISFLNLDNLGQTLKSLQALPQRVYKESERREEMFFWFQTEREWAEAFDIETLVNFESYCIDTICQMGFEQLYPKKMNKNTFRQRFEDYAKERTQFYLVKFDFDKIIQIKLELMEEELENKIDDLIEEHSKRIKKLGL